MKLTFREKEDILEAIYSLVQQEIQKYDFEETCVDLKSHNFQQHLKRLDELDKLRNKFEKELI